MSPYCYRNNKFVLETGFANGGFLSFVNFQGPGDTQTIRQDNKLQKICITKKFKKTCVVTINFYSVVGIFQVNSSHVTIWLN